MQNLRIVDHFIVQFKSAVIERAGEDIKVFGAENHN